VDGVVIEFDEHRCLGTVVAGDERYPFHCTAIADGSRTIEVGAEVHFEVAPGLMGRWEARRLERR
jgi:cold shock CspA family protein